LLKLLHLCCWRRTISYGLVPHNHFCCGLSLPFLTSCWCTVSGVLHWSKTGDWPLSQFVMLSLNVFKRFRLRALLLHRRSFFHGRLCVFPDVRFLRKYCRQSILALVHLIDSLSNSYFSLRFDFSIEVLNIFRLRRLAFTFFLCLTWLRFSDGTSFYFIWRINLFECALGVLNCWLAWDNRVHLESNWRLLVLPNVSVSVSQATLYDHSAFLVFWQPPQCCLGLSLSCANL